MCQQFRLGGDDLGERGFEDFGNALVVLLARALQERLVGRVLDQGVLEAVRRLGRCPLLVEEFGRDQLRKALMQRILTPRGDGS